MRIRQPSFISHSSRGHACPTEALITAAVLATLAASVPAQRQFDELPSRVFPADSDRTSAVALGDVDGDGDLDMVSENYRGKHHRLYLNLLRQLDTPFLTTPGREFRLEGYARHGPPRPGDLAFAFISTARATMPLPPFGTLGIDLSQAAGLPPFLIPQPGMGSVSFTVPNQPRLIGVSVYVQALLLPFGGPCILTNVTADQIAR